MKPFFICKYSEVLWKGVPMAGVAGSRGHAGAGVFAGLAWLLRWLRPGPEVFGAGVPGQEAFEVRP